MTNQVGMGSNPYVFESYGTQQSSNLSYSFLFSAAFHEFDNSISSLRRFIWLLPRSDPWHARSVQCLARTRFMRYRLSGQLDDLEQSTLGFTQAIYLPRLLDSRPRDLNIVQIFHSLTLALYVRAEESRQPKDVGYCIMYLRYLREQWYEVPFDMPLPVAGTLVCTLAIQVELKLGDVDYDIEEMAELFDELLTSDTSNTFLTDPTIAFARVVDANLEGPIDGQVPSEKVIRCLRMVIRRLPDLHDGSIVLAQSLFNRFNITASDDDYNEGMAILDKVIAFRDSGDRLSPYSKRALALASTFAFARFSACGKPEHLEQMIYRTQIWLEGTSLEDPTRTVIAGLLSDAQSMRSHGP